MSVAGRREKSTSPRVTGPRPFALSRPSPCALEVSYVVNVTPALPSRRPGAAIEWGIALVEKLYGAAHAANVAKTMIVQVRQAN